jgi:hypothetical protein
LRNLIYSFCCESSSVAWFMIVLCIEEVFAR